MLIRYNLLMDQIIRHLASQAGTGDLDAARKLVRYLERRGLPSQEDALIKDAKDVILAYTISHETEEPEDLFDSSDLGMELAEKVLKYLMIIKV